VLVARMTERLIAVNLATSTVTWAVDGEIDYVVVAGRGTVYAFESGAMVARAVSDGSTSWTWMPPESCGTRTGMVITNNILFVGCEATTYALDLTARRPVWSYPAGGFLSLSGPQGALYIANGQQLTAISLR
jgi:outer membrane protein assembly factor BamB